MLSHRPIAITLTDVRRLLLFTLVLCGCPGSPAPLPGELYARYDVVGVQSGNGCDLGPEAVTAESLSLRVRLATDVDAGAVWMTPSQSPGFVESGGVRGRAGDGGVWTFTGDAFQNIPFCGCSPSVTETFTFSPAATAPDGGTDGGTGAPDGGTAPSGPHLGWPEAPVDAIEGRIDYEMTGTCTPVPYDGGTACTFPCAFGYALSGSRVAE